MRTHVGVGVQRHVIENSVWNFAYDVSEKHFETNLQVNLSCRQSLDDSHRRPTGRTQPGRSWPKRFPSTEARGAISNSWRQSSKRRGSLVVGHEAEVPDADEALREHVQQEAANELLGGNGHRALLVAVSIIPPAERDVVAIEGEQSMIGDGDAMGIAAEVTQHLLGTAEGGLCINNPFLPEQRSQESGEALRLGQVLDRAGEGQTALPVQASFNPSTNLPRKTLLRTLQR